MEAATRFQVGQRVRVERRDAAVLARVHGAESCRWNPRMSKHIGNFGWVFRVTDAGHMRLNFYEAEKAEHGSMRNAMRNQGIAELRWTFLAAAVSAAPRVFFAPGDRVIVCPEQPYLSAAHGDGYSAHLRQAGVVVSTADATVCVRVGELLVDVLNKCVVPVYEAAGERVLRADGIGADAAAADRLVFGPQRPLDALAVSHFHEASRTGDEHGLSFFLHRHSEHVDETSADSAGRTALMFASETGQRSVAQILLMVGASPQRQDADGFTSLHCAVFGKQAQMVDTLLDWAPHLLNMRNHRGETPLHLSVYANEPTLTEKLLSKVDVDANAQDCRGDTPLHKALALSDARELDVLLACARVDVGTPNNHGFNALHYAAMVGDLRNVRALLSRSAELLAVPKSDGYLPLHLAALNGHGLVVEDLLRRVNDGKTALHLAAMFASDGLNEADEQRLHAALALLDAGAPADGQDGNGDTALHLGMKALGAACERRRQLPAADIIVALQTMDAHNASCAAIVDKCSEWPVLAFVCFLLSRGASLDARNKDDFTAPQLLNQRPLELIWQHFGCASVSPSARDGGVLETAAACEPGAPMMCSMSYCEGENVADVQYVPCGHRVMCADCARLVAVRRCQKCGVLVEALRDLDGRELDAASELRRLRERCEQLETANTELRHEFETAVTCAICMDRRTTVVFGCGHVACAPCSAPDVLRKCHTCRQPIFKRQPLYPNWNA